MHLPVLAALAPLLLAVQATPRFLMYYDQWHPTLPTDPADKAAITHIILAFAPANNSKATWQSFIPVSQVRQDFPNAKVMAAIGGWGELFWHGQVTSNTTIKQFAADVQTMIHNNNLDGVDIDWEYPGGNGIDYKTTLNSQLTYEIPAYPILLAKTREAIGPNKTLTIAVPGKKGDMIAFTKQTAASIFEPVDFINIMSYDLVNRRDTMSGHHSSVAGCAATVQNYLELGAPPHKINLGFAYYAKYFPTVADCSPDQLPTGCPLAPMEDPTTGDDLGTSGAWTYEKANMVPVDTSQIKAETNGACGAVSMTKCAAGYCCSVSGYCGTTKDYCSGGCQHAFGDGCTSPDLPSSWQRAVDGNQTDSNLGGMYYFDPSEKLFWTWDDPALYKEKFAKIVDQFGLGGVFAWSLGEDSWQWNHIASMASLAAGDTDAQPASSSSVAKAIPTAKKQLVQVPVPVVSAAPTTSANWWPDYYTSAAPTTSAVWWPDYYTDDSEDSADDEDGYSEDNDGMDIETDGDRYRASHWPRKRQ